MALRYGIFVRKDCWGDRQLIAHECVHTAQYERCGFRGFLEKYLRECLEIGYPAAPMEQEAILKSAAIPAWRGCWDLNQCRSIQRSLPPPSGLGNEAIFTQGHHIASNHTPSGINTHYTGIMGLVGAGECGHGHVHLGSDKFRKVNLCWHAQHLIDLSWVQKGCQICAQLRMALFILRIFKASGVIYRAIHTGDDVKNESQKEFAFFKFALLRGNRSKDASVVSCWNGK